MKSLPGVISTWNQAFALPCLIFTLRIKGLWAWLPGLVPQVLILGWGSLSKLGVLV